VLLIVVMDISRILKAKLAIHAQVHAKLALVKTTLTVYLAPPI
jgi:hypothetical protein